MSVANWVASLGVGILLIAFFLNIFGYVDNKSKLYALLNAIGGLISCYASWMVDFYPFVVLNIIWSFTAILSLFKGTVSRETFNKKS
ncbi:CBU_0592 family membrane protein [Pedobacter cryophilus]|uniref:CBU-0592-like domain-containing protein n=1 Tax=Pedobacter cryophilus TaxID=2571271 RepID=A0A4V5NXT9_9SPHI|nr:hypothetical protein [Pedobacter cryophilus]TKC00691.1 hypothetical protein FA046_03160 [Pedobacter cryophilus]